MFQVKCYSSILSKVCLFFIISGTPLGYCREELQKKIAPIHGRNFTVNQISLHYLENKKQIGLFAAGKRHHIWGELAGTTDKPFFQIGTGYRFLSKKTSLAQNSFWGLYTYLRPYDYVKYFERLGWTIGFEKANPSWQGTLNFYGCYAIKEPNQFTNQYHEERFGLSGRLSWYLMQRMMFFGRFNPFVFVAYTDVQHIETHVNKTIFFGIKNGGFGIRWEQTYFALEGRANWDSVKSGVFLKANYELGLEIKLTNRYQTQGSYPMHRLYETPQGYKPNYNVPETARASFCSAYDEQCKKFDLPSPIMFGSTRGEQASHSDLMRSKNAYRQSEEELLITVNNETPKKPLIGTDSLDNKTMVDKDLQQALDKEADKAKKVLTPSSKVLQSFKKDSEDNSTSVSSHTPPPSPEPFITSLSQDTIKNSRSKSARRKPKPIRTAEKSMAVKDMDNNESTGIKPIGSLQEQVPPRTPTPIRSRGSNVLDDVLSMESKLRETNIEADKTDEEEEFYTPTFQPEKLNTPKPSAHSPFVPALSSFSRTKQSTNIFSPDPTPSKLNTDVDKISEEMISKVSPSEEVNSITSGRHPASFSQKLQALIAHNDTPGMHATANQPLGILRYKASSGGLFSDAQIQSPTNMQPFDDEVD